MTQAIDEPNGSPTLRSLLASGDQAELRLRLASTHPADIADFMDQLPPSEAIQVFGLLDDATAGEVLDELSDEMTQAIVEQVAGGRMADLLEELPMDDAAEILAELPADTAESLIELMQPQEAAEVRQLLSYPEDTAGRIMTSDVARARREWTVADTLQYLSGLGPDTETLYYLYVVEDGERLVGVLPLRALVTASPGQTVEELMTTDVVSVSVDADQERLAEVVAKYDFFAIPVVDQQSRFLGIVTVDDALDILKEEATEDIQRLGGSEPLDMPYFATSIGTVVRKRVGWLLLLFVAETFTGSVLRLFQGQIEQVVALSFFIPLLIGTGGNAGSQTVSTIIRALALREIRTRDLFRVVLRELATGVGIGLLLGVVVYFRALTWGTGSDIAVVVALSLPLIAIWANFIGALIPLVAQRLRIDPTVISAPFITTLVDATGLAFYFLIAKAVLGL
jgi:magnesium transporter